MVKKYYSVKEVAEMLDEEEFMIRYWHKKFEGFSAQKKWKLRYTPTDVAYFKIIQKLLRVDHYQLGGAQEAFRKEINKRNKKSIKDLSKNLKVSAQKYV